MTHLKALWNKVPQQWRDRALGAAGMYVTAQAGPVAKVVWDCLRAHYGL